MRDAMHKYKFFGRHGHSASDADFQQTTDIRQKDNWSDRCIPRSVGNAVRHPQPLSVRLRVARAQHRAAASIALAARKEDRNDHDHFPKFPTSKPYLGAMTAESAIVLATLITLTQRGTSMIPINSMTIGAAPPNFEFSRTGQGTPGKWIVVSDATADAQRAIEQSDTDPTNYRFPLAIYRPLSMSNVDIFIRFKPIAGNLDRAGGIAVRVTDPDNYYVVRANALEDNVRFYRVVRGRREQLAGIDTKVAADEWHTLRLRADGDRFAIVFNGRPVFMASDRTIVGAGRIALWTKADSITRFDRIEIKELP
jgi:hypothetical protein